MIFLNGPIAQLGERIVRNDEVVGSIPIWSTKTISTPFSGQNYVKKRVLLWRNMTRILKNQITQLLKQCLSQRI